MRECPLRCCADSDVKSGKHRSWCEMKLGIQIRACNDLELGRRVQEYPLRCCTDGEVKLGKEIMFGGVPAGYCQNPAENVVYLGCHDNETLYDTVVLKANHKGDGSVVARIVQMALGVIAVSQGVAFFHAGDDLLRSKSLDRDSYNSGDWFNKLLWDGSSNNFAVCSLL